MSSSQLLDAEQDLGAVRTPDPVSLARLDRLGPVHGLQVVEQDLRVVRDPEEPLLHEARLDLCAAALAAPVDDLLVRQHRLIVGAPLDRRGLPVGEPAFVETEELPLLPAVVLGLVRGELARPVDRPADALHGLADRRDVAVDDLAGMTAFLDGRVLGRQPERVEALWVQDPHPVPAPEVGDDVADRVDEHVAHVQLAGRVREHLQHVALRNALDLVRAGIRHLEGALVLPDALPLLLDSLGVVPLHHRLSSPRDTKKPLAREASWDRHGSRRVRSLGVTQEAAAWAGNRNRHNRPMSDPVLDLFPDSARTDEGELVLGGLRASELAERYGTPLCVYCEQTLRARARQAEGAVPDAFVVYASKAFPNVAIMRLFAEEGLGADVASLGELAFARAAGIEGDRLFVHGNAKSDEELAAARDAGATVVLDAEDEVERAAASGVARVLVRVTLGVEADTHEAIRTGHHGSKFGLPPDAALRAVDRARGLGLDVAGLHIHVGSQLADTKAHDATVERLASFAVRCRDELDWTPGLVNVGGGFAVRHVLEEPELQLGEVVQAAADGVSRAWSANELLVPAVVLEPGRALVGEAGVTLYRVRSVKRLGGVTWVAVDGGMSDNPRPQLYGARYTAVVATRVEEPPTETVSIAGLHCESGDVLVDDVELPEPSVGDLLAVPVTGAYTLAMSSNYNATPRPAAVLVADGEARLIRRRETVDDLLSLETTHSK